MTRALIVIDIQESFRQRPNWQVISNPQVADRAAQLVDFARERGDLVVWVLHAEPGTGGAFDPVNGHVRLIPPLAADDGEPVLTKTAHNAFTTTRLQQLLTQHGVTELTGSRPTWATRSRSSPRRPRRSRYRTATRRRTRPSPSCWPTRGRCPRARSSSGPSTRSPAGSRRLPPSPRSSARGRAVSPVRAVPPGRAVRARK
jgi:hypothetical protein